MSSALYYKGAKKDEKMVVTNAFHTRAHIRRLW